MMRVSPTVVVSVVLSMLRGTPVDAQQRLRLPSFQQQLQQQQQQEVGHRFLHDEHLVADYVGDGLKHLGLCEGDCDHDDDCATPGAICYHRRPGDDLPFCVLSHGLRLGTADFCVLPDDVPPVTTKTPFFSSADEPTMTPLAAPTQTPVVGPTFHPTRFPTSVPTKNPTRFPTAVPTAAPTLPSQTSAPTLAPIVDAVFIGNGNVANLQRCQGDCDNDSECADGLVCFQRVRNQDVPGCRLSAELFAGNLDYCIPASFVARSEEDETEGGAMTLAPTPQFVEDESITLEPSTVEPTTTAPSTQAPTVAPVSTPTAVPTLTPISAPTAVPTTAPITAPTTVPTTAPSVLLWEDETTMLPTSTTEEGILPAQVVGNNNVSNLALCQGDCDTDADCAGALVCYQRELGDPLPGCELSPFLLSGNYDYCVVPDRVSEIVPSAPIVTTFPPTRVPTAMPTRVPTLNPTHIPTATPTNSPNAAPVTIPTDSIPTLDDDVHAVFVGNDDNISHLGLCEGDCDRDHQCAGDLVCFHRNAGTPVPGCVLSEFLMHSHYDFCVEKPQPPSTPVAHPPPTKAPIAVPTFGSNHAMLIGNYDAISGLGLCQGDCDRDHHCAGGLVCFHRNAGTPVPGCVLSDDLMHSHYDFCVEMPPQSRPDEVETMTAIPTQSPISVNTPAFFIGNEDDTSNLSLCQADCDQDSDCMGDLVCFQRNAGTPVPGCVLSDDLMQSHYDLCVERPPQSRPEEVEMMTATPALSPISLDTTAFFIGNEDDTSNLSLCQADCDQDSDCMGDLVCFQRNAGTPVPGCVLPNDLMQSHHDLCVERPPQSRPEEVELMTATPTLSPISLDTTAFFIGNEDDTANLSLCQADCDQDSDCMGDLVCFQRNAGTFVPGCVLPNDLMQSHHDLCVERPVQNEEASVPTDTPVAAPTVAPTNSPVAVPVAAPTDSNRGVVALFVGNEDDTSNLGLCEADCDKDSDCAGQLVCFQRNGGTSVPGCSLSDSLMQSHYDFCVEIPSSVSQPENAAAPTPSSTVATTEPTGAPVTAPPTFDVEAVYVSNGDHENAPLGLCQGDCDENHDCEGDLICFQRNGGTPVPGCTLGTALMSSHDDFCIEHKSNSAVVIKTDHVHELLRCQGNCNSDADCGEGLVCFEREPGKPVPGCVVSGKLMTTAFNFCVAREEAEHSDSNMFALELYSEDVFDGQVEPPMSWCLSCSGTCLEGIGLVIASCEGPTPQWVFVDGEENGAVQIQLAQTHLCIAVGSGDILELTHCDSELEDQLFVSSGDAGFDAYRFEILPMSMAGMCWMPDHHDVVTLDYCTAARWNEMSFWTKY